MSTVSREQVSAGFKWTTSAAIVQGISQVVSLAVLSRLLSPYEFGVVSIAVLVTQLSLVFSEFGVGPCVVQRQMLSDEFLGTAFRLSCLFGMVVAIGIWITAPTLSSAFRVDQLTEVLRAYALIFVIKGWAGTAEAIVQREMQFRFLAVSDAISFIVGYMLISITAAWFGLSYWSIVLGHMGQSIIKAVLVQSRHPHLSRLPVNRREAVGIVRFGMGQTLARLGSLLGSQADGYVVATRVGVVAMGLYGRANQLVTMPPAQLGQIFDRIIFPVIARMQEDRNQIAAAYRLALTSICLLSLPAATFLAIFGREVVGVILGDEWGHVAEPLRILAIAIPFRLLHKVSDPTARGLGATYSRAWRQWLFAGLVFAFSLAMSSSGIAGIAIAVVVAAIIDAGLMTWLCCRLMNLEVPDLAASLMPGIRLSLIIAIATIPAGLMISDSTSQQLFVLSAAICITLATAVVCLVAWPNATLGAHGEAAIQVVLGRSNLSRVIPADRD